ncbi:hypothetical protein C1645_740928 [Glomus cerebriforme]|uniref:RNase III domain-containing protein n=1 Tax=Glomus cerebriforme TaxID=658196 RepID=A0A397SL06_9GLOM|nr:hypothetical protein C1645_740928 [Glomus cerebriforme]
MSTVQKSRPVIIIDDDENIVETEIGQSKNIKFEKPNEKNLIRNLENEAEQSNAQKTDPVNSGSNLQVESSSFFTRTFTAMLGTFYGMTPKDVDELMKSENCLMSEFQNSIETLSKLFKDSSSKEIPADKKDSVNTSRIPLNVSLGISANEEIPGSNFINIPINNMDPQKSDAPINKSIPVVTSINKEMPVNLQRDNVLIGTSVNSTQKPENSRNENLSSETSSGIKIGDNWELPIIVLDSDDDDYENEVIEIDSDEEEIQEFKKMMSLDDFECIEIGKDEFDVVVNAKKEDNEIVEDSETDDETIAPCPEGNLFRKRRRKVRVRAKSARQKISDTSSVDLNSLNGAPNLSVTSVTSNLSVSINLNRASNLGGVSTSGSDPTKWRKDLPQFPHITDHVLRTWATGFLCYRKEWERLEYLGDKVLMFCVLRFATAKYLQFYTPSDIKIVTTFMVSNKLLAAYSLTLGLDKQNQMRGDLTKKVADAFEAYIGAYYLSDGEEATTRYLDQLMSPLFELILQRRQTGRNAGKVMNVIAEYFNMNFLTRMAKLSK